MRLRVVRGSRVLGVMLALAAMVGCGTGSPSSGTTSTTSKAPVASAGGPYTGKIGSAVSLSGAGSSDPQGQTLTYAWSFGDGGTGTGVSPTHTYTTAGTFTVSLTVTNTSGLSGTATTTATIVAQAPVASAGGPYAAKTGVAIAFSGAGSSDPQGEALTFAWSFGDGGTGTGVSPAHAYGAAGTFTVSLTVTNTSGVSATATTTAVIAAQAPTANANGPYAGKIGVALAFTGAGSSDPQGQTLTYAWNFGDGSTGTGAGPTHAYAAAGTYTVMLTVTDTSGLSATAMATATITAQPPVANAGGPYTGHIGVAAAFSGAASSDPQAEPLTYAWNFGDGATGTGVSPTHAYSAAGTYTVSLTVTNTSSLTSTSTTTAVITAQAPVANAGGPYTGHIGVAVAFSGVGSSDPQGEALTYAWSFGDGGTGTGVSPSHTYTTAGTFTVSLTVTNTSSLTTTSTTTAVITAQAPVANAGGPYSSNIGLAIVFSGAGSSDPQGETLTYAWSFGDGGTGTGVSPSHTYTAAGTFTVSLTVTNTSSLTATATTTATITARAPVANAGGPYTGITGTAVSFSGSGSSDPQGETLTYAWAFGDGGTGTGVSPTHTYTTAGTYTVSLTVTNTASLTGTATTTATITLAVDFTLSASPQSVALADGSSEVLDLLVTPLNGFTGSVTVKLSGLPAGVTANASSYTLTPGLVTQATLTATSTAAASIATVTATGTSGTLSHTAGVVLTTGAPSDYYIATSGPGVSLNPGESQSFYLTAYAENGFTGTVNGTITGLPAGVTASPASLALPLGVGKLVTLTASSTAAAGNTVATVGSSSGTTVHNLPYIVNVNNLAQDFFVSTPVSVTIAPSQVIMVEVYTGGSNGFDGAVTFKVTGLPTGVTANSSTYTTSLESSGTVSVSITLTGAATLANGTSSFTITGTSGSLTHTNTVLITTSPNTIETATVNPASPGTAFPSHFIGFSMPDTTLTELTGTGTTTWPSFINLLGNLKTYIGSPSIRSTLTNSDINELAALTKGATFTVNGVTTTPQFFLTTGSAFTLANDATDVQELINAVGNANLLGIELDNEPDLYVSNGYRPTGWTYWDYLNETQSFQTTFAPYVTAPKYMATAAAGRGWDIGIPELMTQMSGQLSTFTAHMYALNSCSGNMPTVTQLMDDRFSHNYYARFAGLVQTLGSIPVRVGEMNSVACEGYAGTSNAFGASLWLVDTAFEAKSAGTVGFNIHSNGTVTAGADPYDIAYNSSTGSLSVYSPFYGVLFLAEAIQNGAKPVPVTITQAAGNIKVWATVDASNTLRVVVLEKDTDGLTNKKTVNLTLGSYTKAGTVTTMTAPTLGSTNGITIAGQTFDGTTNGLLTGTATSSSVTPVGGVYTLTVADGTATMLTVPQ